jgi:hypothetical protein
VLGLLVSLDATAPVISEMSQLHDLADAFNGTVRVDRVHGVNMVVDHRTSSQVGTLGGTLDQLASNIPTPDPLDPSDRNTLLQEADEIMAQLDSGAIKY